MIIDFNTTLFDSVTLRYYAVNIHYKKKHSITKAQSFKNKHSNHPKCSTLS